MDVTVGRMSMPGKPLSVVFLVSGGGGNLRAIHRVAADLPESGFRVVGVIGDRESGATAWSRAKEIPTTVVKYSRQHFHALNRELEKLGPDRIVTNFHRILGSDTLRLFEDRFLNLHYSELPRFAGLIGEAPVRAALEAGDAYVGTTVHRVIEDVDAGPVLGRTRTAMRAGELFADLMTRVFRAGAWNMADVLAREAQCSLPAGLVRDQGFVPSFWETFV